jgi:uncharacterized membrane protein YagU involved in acid resistance
MQPQRETNARDNPGVPLRLASGAVAGVIATVPMTIVMEVLRRALPPAGRDPLPPRRVILGLARKLGLARHMDTTEREGLTWAGHFGYGAGTGAAYGLLDPALKKGIPHPACRGAAYGLGVWLLSYFGWLPAVGITSPQFRRPLRGNATLVLSHLVWGATTGLITERLTARLSRHCPSGKVTGAASTSQATPTPSPLPRKQITAPA